MKSKRFFTCMILTLLVLFSLSGCSFSRHKDITGVTTLTKENIVVMNSPTGKEFVNGSGKITVGDGEHIHLKYDLSGGSIDLAFNTGADSLDIFQDADLENLTPDGEVFGTSNITGSGELDFDVTAGEYTVFFNMHDGVGSATVSIEKD